MKKIILFLFLIPSVFSFYGGDDIEIYSNNIENCQNIQVYISGDNIIDENEYNITNCNKINNTFWNCSCEELILKTKWNTKNKYNIKINVNYEEYISSGGRKKNPRVIEDFDDNLTTNNLTTNNLTTNNLTTNNLTTNNSTTNNLTTNNLTTNNSLTTNNLTTNNLTNNNLTTNNITTNNNTKMEEKSFFKKILNWIIEFFKNLFR